MKMSEKLGFGLNILYPAEQENRDGGVGVIMSSVVVSEGRREAGNNLYFLMKFHDQSRASTHWAISVFRLFSFFNWKIIALQCRVDFCYTTM